MAATMKDVVAYVAEHGIENFRDSIVKKDNREVYNFVSKKLHGFRIFRDRYIQGDFKKDFDEYLNSKMSEENTPTNDDKVNSEAVNNIATQTNDNHGCVETIRMCEDNIQKAINSVRQVDNLEVVRRKIPEHLKIMLISTLNRCSKEYYNGNIARMCNDIAQMFVDGDYMNYKIKDKTFIDNINSNSDTIKDEIVVLSDKLDNLQNLSKLIQDVTNKVGAVYSFESKINSSIGEVMKSLNVLNQHKEVHRKLDLLEEYYLPDMKKKIEDMIKRYGYIKYGRKENEVEKMAYRYMYSILESRYDINIEKVQMAYIEKINATRAKKGKSEIDITNLNVKGIRKIDIVERLGLLCEFFFICKDELDKLIPN